MDMSSMTKSMSPSTTATSAAASATPTMSMSMGGESTCKINMLWNWYTIDACFLSKQWHIHSHGAMAGSCIGVILLVVVLEASKRGAREYDRYLLESYQKNKTTASASEEREGERKFRLTVVQQMIRATFHMVAFAVAYIIMLLAMYYNGFIIISIFIGAWLGGFLCSWDGLRSPDQENPTVCCG